MTQLTARSICPLLIFLFSPFAPQIRLKDGRIVLETGHDSSSTISNEPQMMEIVEE